MELFSEAGFPFNVVLFTSWVLAVTLVLYRLSRRRLRRSGLAGAREEARRLITHCGGQRVARGGMKRSMHPLVALLAESFRRSQPARYFEEEVSGRLAAYRRPDERTTAGFLGLTFAVPFVGMLGTLVGTRGAMQAAAKAGADVVIRTILEPTATAYATTILAIPAAVIAGLAFYLLPTAPLDALEEDLAQRLLEELLELETEKGEEKEPREGRKGEHRGLQPGDGAAPQPRSSFPRETRRPWAGGGSDRTGGPHEGVEACRGPYSPRAAGFGGPYGRGPTPGGLAVFL